MKELNWVEKYRPKKFSEYISSDNNKILAMLRKPFEMPHLLLVSKTAGTGKTTLGRLIIKHLNADYLIMNSSNERRIEDFRNKVLKFAKSAPVNRQSPKIVMMDEFDGVPFLVQEALRNTMETYAAYCKFIITANRINKIHPAIQSRCALLNFKTPPKEKIKERLKFIISNEKLNVSNVDDVVDKLIELHYPSIRNMINQLQLVSLDKNFIKPEDFKTMLDLDAEVYKALKERLFIKARKIWIEHNLNCYELLNSIMELVLKDTELDIETKKAIIWLIADTNFRMAFGADDEIQMAGFAVKFIEKIKNENK